MCLLWPGPTMASEQNIVIPTSHGLALPAKLFLPVRVSAPAIVALHGCAGPLPRRDFDWARRLAAQGHAVLLPDSFAARHQKPECRQGVHAVSAYAARKDDALAAATWLQAQNFAPPGGILLLGWSDGGTTVLAATAAAPAGLLRGAVAFYPACARTARNDSWRTRTPLLIVTGGSDDWTPVAPCAALAARPGQGITLIQYPGAYHDFDVPDDPLHLVTGLPYTKDGTGTAHAGSNPVARAQALREIPAFFATLPPAGGFRRLFPSQAPP